MTDQRIPPVPVEQMSEAALEAEIAAIDRDLCDLDAKMGRVAEDLIALLIRKGVFLKSELPPGARNTLDQIQRLRMRRRDLARQIPATGLSTEG